MNLKQIVQRNFNINDLEQKTLESILEEMMIQLNGGDYDDVYGQVSESSVCDAFDELLYNRLNIKG